MSTFESFLLHGHKRGVTFELDVKHGTILSHGSVLTAAEQKQLERHTEELGLWLINRYRMRGTWGLDVQYIRDNETARSAVDDVLHFNPPITGIDIETAKLESYQDHPQAGLHPALSRIRLVQVYPAGMKKVFLFDMFYVSAEVLRPLMELPLVAHSAKFELQHFIHLGLRPVTLHCTEILARVINRLPREISYALESLSGHYLNIRLSKALQNSDWNRDELLTAQRDYAALDAVLALRLWQALQQRHFNPRAYARFHSMLPLVARQSLQGVHFDFEAHRDLIHEWEKERAAAKESLLAMVGSNVNLNSPLQLSQWVKDNISLEDRVQWPRTEKTGQYSFNKKSLTRLSHPLARLYCKYSQINSLLKSFGRKFTGNINPVTQRLHPGFIILGARTGRFTSRSPNLQNMPRKENFRDLFIAGPGRALIIADFSQIELRIAAVLSQDHTLLSAYINGSDIHRLTASNILGVVSNEVTKEQRQTAKACNFGLLYGAGPRVLREIAQTQYGVDIDEFDAEQLKRAFMRSYPDLQRWQSLTIEMTRRDVYTQLPCGYRRNYTYEVESIDEIYSIALNTPIQGLGAELLILSLSELDQRLEGLDAEIVLHVHDEIVVESNEDIALEVAQHLHDAMHFAYRTLLPDGPDKGLVEDHMAPSWGAAKRDETIIPLN